MKLKFRYTVNTLCAVILIVLSPVRIEASKPYIAHYVDLNWEIFDVQFRFEIVGAIGDESLSCPLESGKKLRFTIGGKRASFDFYSAIIIVAVTTGSLLVYIFRKRRQRRTKMPARLMS